MHLARGGWVRWKDKLPSERARPSRGPLALRMGFDATAGFDGTAGFDVTEMGTEKRLALWVVGHPEEVEGSPRSAWTPSTRPSTPTPSPSCSPPPRAT